MNNKITRSEAIEMILQDDIDTIKSEDKSGADFLNSILRYGHEGYQNMNTTQLASELEGRFDKLYIVEG